MKSIEQKIAKNHFAKKKSPLRQRVQRIICGTPLQGGIRIAKESLADNAAPCYFIAPLLALNARWVLDGMFIFWLVAGCIPVRLLRLLIEKLPNPTIVTGSPLVVVATIISVRLSIRLATTALFRSVFEAKTLISSFLFMVR